MHLPYATSSGLRTADAQIYSGYGALTLVEVISDGTNVATLSVYDGISSAGVLLLKLSIPATTAAPEIYPINVGCSFNQGLFVDVGGTGAAYVVHYIPA